MQKTIISSVLASLALIGPVMAFDTPTMDYKVTLNCNLSYSVNETSVSKSGPIYIDGKELTPTDYIEYAKEVSLQNAKFDFFAQPLAKFIGKDPSTFDYHEIFLTFASLQDEDNSIIMNAYMPIGVKTNKSTGECVAYKNETFISTSSFDNPTLGISVYHNFSCDILRVEVQGKPCPVMNK